MTDLVLRVFYMAVCVDCEFALPFGDEPARDEWARVHRTIGHRVRSRTDKVWREPVVIDGTASPR